MTDNAERIPPEEWYARVGTRPTSATTHGIINVTGYPTSDDGYHVAWGHFDRKTWTLIPEPVADGTPHPDDYLLRDGEQELTPAAVAASVLHHYRTPQLIKDDEMVATWDEGRWWTQTESNAYVARLIHEIAQARA